MLDVMEIDIDRPEKVVYVVGLGPGEPFYMTQQAANTLESVDAICGYKVYLDLIRDEFPCEEYYATGMTQELDRCRWALEKARTGKRVALVCSGDAGVYGMASPLLELAPDYPDVAVEVVPGPTADPAGIPYPAFRSRSRSRFCASLYGCGFHYNYMLCRITGSCSISRQKMRSLPAKQRKSYNGFLKTRRIC